MQGIIEQVSISGGGMPKRSIGSAWAGTLGLEGDRHNHPNIHGGPQKALLLVSAEDLDELRALGFAVEAGTLGENLTVRGLDFRKLASGQRWRAGGALLELTTLRRACLQLEPLNGGEPGRIQQLLTEAHARGGFYAAVVKEGEVKAGDIIALAGQPA